VSARWLPNINWVRAIVCPAVVFIAMNMDRGYQTDFWHHLARGREIALAGRIPDAESMVFTVAGESVRDPNWLTQLAYYGLFRLGGLGLVQTVNSLILAATAGILVWICRRRSGSMPVAAAVGVFTVAGIWQTLLIRPQSVSLLLFMTLYAILLEAEQRRRLLVIPPILTALWANVHGGFPIGLMLVGAFLAAAVAEHWTFRIRRCPFIAAARDDVDGGVVVVVQDSQVGSPALTDDPSLRVRGQAGMISALPVCFAACVFATLLNPYGLNLYRYVFSLSQLAAGREIEEWLPPSMNLWVGRAWAVSVVATIALLALAPRRPRARDVFVALCFLPLAAASVRMIPWWLLAVAPVLATTIARSIALVRAGADQLRRPKARHTFAAGTMMAVIALACAISLPSLEKHNPVFGTLRPSARVESNLQVVLDGLQPVRSAQAHVFTRLEWGEYVDWAGRARRVSPFMDGRIEIYGDDLWREYHVVSAAGEGWQSILNAHDVDYLLLDQSQHARLISRVVASGDWLPLARAGPAILYGRVAQPSDVFVSTHTDDR
jgi:hypothetical protein